MSQRKKNGQKKAAEIKIELSFPQIIQISSWNKIILKDEPKTFPGFGSINHKNNARDKSINYILGRLILHTVMDMGMGKGNRVEKNYRGDLKCLPSGRKIVNVKEI